MTIADRKHGEYYTATSCCSTTSCVKASPKHSLQGLLRQSFQPVVIQLITTVTACVYKSLVRVDVVADLPQRGDVWPCRQQLLVRPDACPILAPLLSLQQLFFSTDLCHSRCSVSRNVWCTAFCSGAIRVMIQPCAAAATSLEHYIALVVLADAKPEMLIHLAALHSSSTSKT